MKIKICPICGKVIDVAGSIDGRYWHQGKKLIEIIPLVTPQEVKHG